MEHSTSQTQTSARFKPMLHNGLNSPALLKRAPKYIGHVFLLNMNSAISDKLKKLKFVKEIRHKSTKIDLPVRHFRLRHQKTLTEDTNSDGKDIISRKVSKCQLKYASCRLSIYKWPFAPYRRFLTKVCAQKVLFDLEDCREVSKTQYEYRYMLRAVRHLTQLKQLKHISLVFRELYSQEHMYRFLQLLDNTLPFVSQEAKIRLTLVARIMSSSNIKSLDILRSFKNIAQRTTDVEIDGFLGRGIDLSPSLLFIPSLKNLVSLRLYTEGGHQSGMLDVWQMIFENNLALEKLSLTAAHPYNDIKPFEFGAALMNHKEFFSGLRIIQIHLPSSVISFQGLNNAKSSEQNLILSADQIMLEGSIDDLEGFRYFVQGLKPHCYKGSRLIVALRPYKENDVNSLLKALQGYINVENLHITRLNRAKLLYIDCYVLLKFLNRITGPQEISVVVSFGRLVLTDWDHERIQEACENSKRRMQAVTFCFVCPVNQTRMKFEDIKGHKQRCYCIEYEGSSRK